MLIDSCVASSASTVFVERFFSNDYCGWLTGGFFSEMFSFTFGMYNLEGDVFVSFAHPEREEDETLDLACLTDSISATENTWTIR